MIDLQFIGIVIIYKQFSFEKKLIKIVILQFIAIVFYSFKIKKNKTIKTSGKIVVSIDLIVFF